MKKAPLLLIGILVLALSACGASAAATPVEPSPAPEQNSAPATEPPAAITEAPVATEAMAAEAMPTEAPAQQPSAQVSFANDVLPILNNSCNKCHGLDQTKEGLDMTSYDTLMAGSFNGAVVIAGNAAESPLVDLVARGKMPKRGDKLTADQLQILTDWVNTGAPNN